MPAPEWSIGRRKRVSRRLRCDQDSGLPKSRLGGRPSIRQSRQEFAAIPNDREACAAFNNVGCSDRREVRAVAPAGCGISIIGAGRSTTTAKGVGTDDEVAIYIDCLARPYGNVPPPRLIFRMMACSVRISAQGVADQNRVILRCIQIAVSFVA